ncbi:MAG: hypothetical protein R3D55_03155 [Chloroflexota bacterium]
MELNKKKPDTAKGHFKVLLTFIFAIVGLSLMIQALATSKSGGTERALAQGPVITPTLTTEEQIQAYIDAHIIVGDVMPEEIPGQAAGQITPEDTQSVAALAAAWNGNQVLVGSPGAVVTYTLTLSNTGTENDAYDITISSAWASSLSDATVSVNSGNSSLISGITILGGAATSDSNTATVTATSQADALLPLLSCLQQLPAQK